MGLRTIRVDGDPLLRKVSRPVTKIDDRILQLLDDMVDTMKSANGIGIAAPQIGVLRRLIIVDVGNGKTYRMINPEILETDGSQIAVEGCLSIPNFNGTVERPEKIKVRYMDPEGKDNVIEADGLFARCICHEVDHLNGILFNDIYIDEITYEQEENNE
ncbi:peptide deformylase [Peptoniphilaceae bacterium SGI.131]